MKNDVKTGSAALLSYITATANASSEDSVSALLEIMNPTDNKNEMGEKYVDTLGYNPITYFDEQYLVNKLRVIADEAPSEVASHINECNTEIIATVMTHKENLDSEYLDMLLAETLETFVGWSPKLPTPFSVLVSDELFDTSFEVDEVEEIDDDDAEDDVLEVTDDDLFEGDID